MRRTSEDAREPAPATAQPWLLLVEDNVLVARAFTRVILPHLPVRVAGTVVEARDLVDAAGLAGAIVDVNLPDGNGLDVVEALVRSRPDVAVVVCSGERDMAVVDRATRLGAGFFSKDEARTALARFAESCAASARPTRTQPTPLAARLEAFEARHELTRKQLLVLRLALRRLTYAQIAGELRISEKTVEFHARGIRARTKMTLVDCVREILAEDEPATGERQRAGAT